MPTKLKIMRALEQAGYISTRLYGLASDPALRWAAIKPFAGGFAIASGDLQYVHNEIWWFQTASLAKQSLAAWQTGTGSPPNISRHGPRCISRKGKLRSWNEHG